MNKHIIWGTLMFFAIVNLILSYLESDYERKQVLNTRANIFIAASFVVLSIP